MSASTCVLCAARRKLEQSHIIPQFVYRWAKSAGHAIPRAPTRAMLCGECEDLFSSHESEFARLVFHPAAAGSPLSVKYGGWLRKFAASVCWRILEDGTATGGLERFNGRWAAELTACRDTWKAYLNGKRPDVGPYHLHLLSVGAKLIRVIDCDVCRTERGAFVSAHLGPFVLFGVVAEPDPQLWRGTRINAEGKLKNREVDSPPPYRDYLRTRVPSPA